MALQSKHVGRGLVQEWNIHIRIRITVLAVVYLSAAIQVNIVGFRLP